MANDIKNQDDYMSQGRKEYGHKVVIFTASYLKEAKRGYILGQQEWLMNFSLFLINGAIVFVPLMFLALIANGGVILTIGLGLSYIFIWAIALMGNTFNNCLGYSLGSFKTLDALNATLNNLDTIIPRLKKIEKIKDREERETAYYRYVMELDQIYGKGKHLMSSPPEEERKEREREEIRKRDEEKAEWRRRVDQIKARIEEEKRDPKVIRRGPINPINCTPEEAEKIKTVVQIYRDLLNYIDEVKENEDIKNIATQKYEDLRGRIARFYDGHPDEGDEHLDFEIECYQEIKPYLKLETAIEEEQQKVIKVKAKEYYEVVSKIEKDYLKEKGVYEFEVYEKMIETNDKMYSIIGCTANKCILTTQGKAGIVNSSSDYELYEYFGLRHPEMSAQNYYNNNHLLWWG